MPYPCVLGSSVNTKNIKSPNYNMSVFVGFLDIRQQANISYVIIKCNHCDYSLSISMDLESVSLYHRCPECGNNIGVLPVVKNMLNVANYNGLIIENWDSLAVALHRAITISVVDTYRSIHMHVNNESDSNAYFHRYLNYINAILKISMFRNTRSYEKIKDALHKRKDTTVVDYGIEKETLISHKNLGSFIGKIKTSAMIFRKNTVSGAKRDFVYFRLAKFLIILPEELFGVEFLTKLRALKGLPVTKKTKKEKEKENPFIRDTKTYMLKTVAESTKECSGCGVDLDEDDFNKNQCSSCGVVFKITKGKPVKKEDDGSKEKEDKEEKVKVEVDPFIEMMEADAIMRDDSIIDAFEKESQPIKIKAMPLKPVRKSIRKPSGYFTPNYNYNGTFSSSN